jgi:hypothetical protein
MSYRPITDQWILARAKLTNGHKLYGAYLGGFVERARALLGVHISDPVLHVCGGRVRHYPYPDRAVGPNDKTLDLDPAMTPDFLQDARHPYPTGFRAILADPPYSEVDADHYVPGRDCYPTPNTIVRNALAVLDVGCRVGILHYGWPGLPTDGLEIAVVAVGTGRNGRARWYTVVEKLAAPRKHGGSATARRKALEEASDG